MKKIALDELNDIIFRNNCDLNSFMGITVTKHRDINGVAYELKHKEDKYYRLGKFENSLIFVSENRLLRTLLKEYIDEIESGSIYGHGYPESRLIPSTHYEDCQEGTLDNILEEVTEKIKDIIGQYF